MPNARVLILAAASLAVAGCFNEPTPAYKTVPEGARVYATDRKLTTLAEAARGWNAEIVDYANLDRNELTNIDDIVRFGGLKWLRLNDNALTALPNLGNLKALRRIYLRNNRLTTVPETLKDLPELTDIDLSGNPLTEIPDWLAQKTGLKNLAFNRTRVTRLPADLTAWKSLQMLQLGDLTIPAEEMARIRKALPQTAIAF